MPPLQVAFIQDGPSIEKHTTTIDNEINVVTSSSNTEDGCCMWKYKTAKTDTIDQNEAQNLKSKS